MSRMTRVGHCQSQFISYHFDTILGGKKSGEEEDEAQKIYREIIEVVSSASPASLQAVRGRMVGYGEEAGATLRRAARGRQERPGGVRGQPGGRHR